MFNLSLALLHISTRIQGTELSRIRQRSSYQGTLATEEILRFLVEMILSHGIDTIDTRSHLDTVEIDLHDALLAPHHFDEKGEIHLKSLAGPGTARPEENVLGGLLTDGTGTMHLTATGIILGSTLNGIEVEAMMLEESGILARHHRHRHVRGYLIHRNPVMMQGNTFTISHLLKTADNHQRSNIYRNKTVGYYSKNGGTEKQHHHPSYDISDLF